jgi:hypothetical protein
MKIDVQRAAIMKQLEPTKFPVHQVNFGNVVHGFYEVSSQTEFEAARIRVPGFKEVAVHAICGVLEYIFDENKIKNLRIFNMGETSLTVSQHPEKIIDQKGKHQVGAISLCKQGQNVTGVHAVSMSGFCLPPSLICPRKRMKNSLSYGPTPGILSVVKAKAGWILKCSVNGSVWLLLKFLANMRVSCCRCLQMSRFSRRGVYAVHSISDRNEAEGEAIFDRPYCVAGRHGVPKGCNNGNDYEWAQE